MTAELSFKIHLKAVGALMKSSALTFKELKFEPLCMLVFNTTLHSEIFIDITFDQSKT